MTECNSKRRRVQRNLITVFATVILAATCCYAQAIGAEEPYSPPVRQPYPNNVYWGDTHLHTYLSGDAVFRLSPDDAYRFAKGEVVNGNSGQPARLRRPLDFLVCADHGNNMGAQLARRTSREDPEFRKSKIGRLWEEAKNELLKTPGVNKERLLTGSLWPGDIRDVAVRHPGFRKSIWEWQTATADRHNAPGNFTAFIGYEWTSSGGAIHRVVIFKDDANRVNQVLPFTSYDSLKPEDLWGYMESYEKETGGSVLAIPHNSNLTWNSGQTLSTLMFSVVDANGQPLREPYWRLRSRWEPLVEATQIKGDSETHPLLSPNDEFADYETWNTWGGRVNGATTYSGSSYTRPDSWLPYQYVRSALKLGLEQKVSTGVNPFKFGLIGSTDSHTGLAAVDENNFWGKTAYAEPKKERMLQAHAVYNWEMNAAGYAAVWSTENTREALFDAMRRREVYSTTGPRMTVRFYGGWDFAPGDAAGPDLAGIGYAKGVPMGGDLTQGPDGGSPSFLIRAVRDPDGANLDRIQVIKGWRDAEGKLHERIHNVALSDGRKADAAGNAPAVGSTVNVKDASYTNAIGGPELAVVWTDPDFSKDELAFYYVRVIEIPTPRWTAYDAKFYGLSDLPVHIQMVTQERAYTSPIWYSP